MKTCKRCFATKPIEDFGKMKASEDGWHYYCKACAYAATKRSLDKAIHKFNSWKEQQPCCDCGQHFPYYVLDMDHRPGEEKLGIVSDLLRSGSVKRAYAEAEKCDVVCANCHRRRTYARSSANVII